LSHDVTKSLSQVPVRTGTLLHAIAVFLEARKEFSWTAKEIALGAPIPKGSVRTILRRGVASGAIANPARGYYQAPSGLVHPAIDPRIRFHGLKFEARCHIAKGGPSRHLYEIVTTRFFSPTMHHHRLNRSLTTTSDWKVRPLTITLHEEIGLLEVFLQASSLPLTLIELYAFLDGWLPAAFDLPTELWMLRQADVNINSHGTTEIALKTPLPATAAIAAILSIYQKREDLVRTEVRIFDTLPAEAILSNAKAILEGWSDLKRRRAS
jgi:hypothetical protein